MIYIKTFYNNIQINNSNKKNQAIYIILLVGDILTAKGLLVDIGLNKATW